MKTTRWPQVRWSASDSMPSAKTTRSDWAVTAKTCSAAMVPWVWAVPVAGEGPASRAYQHRTAAWVGPGGAISERRSRATDRHHPVAPVPVPMSTPEEDCRSVAPSTVVSL
ncbi:MAG: hypothetical protein JWN68_1514 [Nocardioides sp.]|nr:hypothetical protein [Nocardioides sp.]